MAQRIAQSEEELRAHFNEQINFLQSSAKLFDEGNQAEAKRLAATIRVLFHDTRTSISLLKQLNLLGGKFLSTNIPHSENNLLSHGGLVSIQISDRTVKTLAMLDDVPVKRQLDFSDWWNEPIFIDSYKNVLTRKELVLVVANQDGGSHVDPALDVIYSELSRNNSLNWYKISNENVENLTHPELTALRQIAHEVLKSLVSNFNQSPDIHNNFIIAGQTFYQNDETPPHLKILDRKIKRNDLCYCGSGKKYKKCHGRIS